MNSETLETLNRHYPVLSKIDPMILNRALARARQVRFPSGTRLFETLQPCNAFPFVLSGTIRVFKQSAEGRELSLYTVTPGDACVVSAGCLLGEAPYNADGIVKEDCEMIMMPSRDFEILLGSDVFRQYIFSLFSKRVLDLMQLVEQVAFEKLDRRLAFLLLSRLPKGRDTVTASHQELADELGTVREMVTRVLKSFFETGLVRISRGQVRVMDRHGLEKIAEN